MKLTKKQIRNLILKEFKSLNEETTLSLATSAEVIVPSDVTTPKGIAEHMKLTRRQLRRLIMEASGYDGDEPIQLAGYILDRDLKKALDDLEKDLLSAWDASDWTMAGDGYPAWVRQVDVAMAHVKRRVGKDASLIDSVGTEAYDKLMLGEFGEGRNVKWKTKAADVEDLDAEFEAYLSTLTADDDYELEPELDIEREPGPVMRNDNVYYPEFKE